MPIRRRGTQAHSHTGHRAPGAWAEAGPGGSAPGAPPPDRFERLVEEAIDGLPGPLRRLLDRVAVVIEDEPSRQQRRDNDLAPDETLYGLYEGTPLIAWGADEAPFPNKITLFRGPLEADHPDPRDLAVEVRRTLRHELAHHVGFDESGMDHLGLD